MMSRGITICHCCNDLKPSEINDWNGMFPNDFGRGRLSAEEDVCLLSGLLLKMCTIYDGEMEGWLTIMEKVRSFEF